MSRPIAIYLIAVLTLGALLHYLPYTESIPPYAHPNPANNGNPFQPTRPQECSYIFDIDPDLLSPEQVALTKFCVVNIYSTRGDLMMRDTKEVKDQTLPEVHYIFFKQPSAIVVRFCDGNNQEIAHTSTVLSNTPPNVKEQHIILNKLYPPQMSNET